MDLSRWVRAACEFSGLAYAEVGRQMEERLPKQFDRSKVAKIAKNERGLSAAEMIAISEITGLLPPLGRFSNVDDDLALDGLITLSKQVKPEAIYELRALYERVDPDELDRLDQLVETLRSISAVRQQK